MALRTPPAHIEIPVFGETPDVDLALDISAFLNKRGYFLNKKIAYIDKYAKGWSDSGFPCGFNHMPTQKIECRNDLTIYVSFDADPRSLVEKVNKLVKLAKKIKIYKAVITKEYTVFHTRESVESSLTLTSKRGLRSQDGSYWPCSTGCLGKAPAGLK